MLPSLPCLVPVKTKLRQDTGDFNRLLVRKLNPNPSADDFRQFKETRCVAPKHRQKRFGVERLINSASCKVNSRQASFPSAQLFGPALESRFCVCIRFHGLFFVLCCSVSVSRPSSVKAAKQGSSVEVVFRRSRETPLRSRPGEGERSKTDAEMDLKTN
jgi:hypothetical protein